MVIRNIGQAKSELSALLELVQRGEEVIVAKAGKPIARIVRYRGAAEPRTPGALEGQIWLAPDFEELPEDMAEAFEMRGPNQ